MQTRLTLVLLALAACVAGQLSASERDDDRRRLTVSAAGKERITATKADVRLAIEERGATDTEARERMAQRSGALLTFLRDEGVERLETRALRLHPIYDYTRGDREIVGYQAVAVVRFTGQANTIGYLIDEAIARGANQVQELIFTADEEEIEQARQRALQSATRLALARASAVLGELNLTPQQIHRIQLGSPEDEAPIFPPMRPDARAAAAPERSATELEASEPEVRALVTLEIHY